MRKLLTGVGVVLGLVLALAALTMIASESGEVVVLHTTDAAGEVRETRLWVVEHEGAWWLRSGGPGSGWHDRLVARPQVEVVRGGETRPFRAVPVSEARDPINALMAEKYGWADATIDLLFDRGDAVAIRLEPR